MQRSRAGESPTMGNCFVFNLLVSGPLLSLSRGGGIFNRNYGYFCTGADSVSIQWRTTPGTNSTSRDWMPARIADGRYSVVTRYRNLGGELARNAIVAQPPIRRAGDTGLDRGGSHPFQDLERASVDDDGRPNFRVNLQRKRSGNQRSRSRPFSWRHEKGPAYHQTGPKPVPNELQTSFGGPKSIKTERKRARKVGKGVRRRTVKKLC